MSEHLRIVHLGLGVFHRAHQAALLQDLIDHGDDRWRIAAGNIRPGDEGTTAALRAQGGAYTLETVAPDGERRYRRISAIDEVVAYEPGIAWLIALGADPATRIISFTVTEGGYYLDGDDRLDRNAADIRNDIDRARHAIPGNTVYGALTAILRARRAQFGGPLTLLCCDNLRHNGARFRSGLLEFLAIIGDNGLSEWVRIATTSPDSMVDRITPRPPPELRARVRAATNQDDAAPVMAESFIQWVIEGDFAAGHPDWQSVGVEFVDSVRPYEEAKIRVLNGSHCAIAWAGALAGQRYIHDCMRDLAIRRIAHDYVTNAVIASLAPSPVDLPRYRDVVFDRFGNEAIADTVERVCVDSGVKLLGFIVPTIREQLARNESIEHVAALPVLLFAFLKRVARGQNSFAYQDAAIDASQLTWIFDATDPLVEFCRVASIWGDLAGDPRMAPALREAGTRIGYTAS